MAKPTERLPAIVPRRQSTKRDRKWHADRINSTAHHSAQAIIRLGQHLLEAKKELAHGEFQAMVRNDFPFEPRWGEKFMQVASNSVISNAAQGSLLPAALKTLVELSAIDPPQLEQHISEGRVTPKTTAKEARKLKQDSKGVYEEAPPKPRPARTVTCPHCGEEFSP